MSHEAARSSSSHSIPALPPSLHLTSSQEKNDTCPGSSKQAKMSLGWAFHYIVSPRRFGTVGVLEKVPEARVEVENAVCSSRRSSVKLRKSRRQARLPLSISSIISSSRPAASQTAKLSHSPTTLITPFPLLNISNIPCRSPTNKSPYSAIFLGCEDEEQEEDDPELELWRMEQLHRARLAKLTRHLGEEIPTGMVPSPQAAFSSFGTSRPSLSLRRGGHHRRRRSLDPGTFRSEPSIVGSAGGDLRRSKSLRGEGGTRHRLSESVTGTPCKTQIVESAAGSGVHDAGTTSNSMITIPDQVPEGASEDTRSDNPSRPSGETVSENGLFSLHARYIPSRSGTVTRRPATAESSLWRMEKLADFFGVDCEELTTQRLQFSASNSAAGDLAKVDIHAPGPDSQLEVEVKVSKPTRFWSGRAKTKNVHPDVVMASLRAMRAS